MIRFNSYKSSVSEAGEQHSRKERLHNSLPLPVRLLGRAQLLQELLAGEPGHHKELVLGEEVVNKLLFHAPGLKGEWKTSGESEVRPVSQNFFSPSIERLSPYLKDLYAGR